MSEFLFQYVPVHPITWVYLSSLLMIGLFFKFGRFWSVRNLDLVLLILLVPRPAVGPFWRGDDQAGAERDGVGSCGGWWCRQRRSRVMCPSTRPTFQSRRRTERWHFECAVPPPTDLPAPPLAPTDVKEVTPADDFTVLTESADQPAPQPEASPPTRTCHSVSGLCLAVRRLRTVSDPPAARPHDGSSAASGTESVAGRTDVYRLFAVCVSDGQCGEQPGRRG